MINQTKLKAAKEVNQAITQALTERIPFYGELRVDDNPHYVVQPDLYGGVDTITRMASERLYKNQNKSRSDGKTDICIECNSYKNNPINLVTGEPAPIAGAFWCEGWKRWMSPRFLQADTLTYYLPDVPAVLHFSRYYLEIMLSKRAVWQQATGIFRKNDESDIYIAFWRHKDFERMYLETVAQTTYGDGEFGVQTSLEAPEMMDDDTQQ